MVYFGSHDELVVDDIVRCVTHSEQGRCRVQMARHSSTAVHVLTNALKTGSLVEVSCNDKWWWLVDYYSKNAKAICIYQNRCTCALRPNLGQTIRGAF